MAKKGCDNNCVTCGIGNWSYCALQIGKANQELLMKIVNALSPSMVMPKENLIPPAMEEEEESSMAEKK